MKIPPFPRERQINQLFIKFIGLDFRLIRKFYGKAVVKRTRTTAVTVGVAEAPQKPFFQFEIEGCSSPERVWQKCACLLDVRVQSLPAGPALRFWGLK